MLVLVFKPDVFEQVIGLRLLLEQQKLPSLGTESLQTLHTNVYLASAV